MKVGEKINIALDDLLKPQLGNLVIVSLPGEEKDVKARITEVKKSGAVLTVVAKNTKS